jgi:hypothetical protein
VISDSVPQLQPEDVTSQSALGDSILQLQREVITSGSDSGGADWQTRSEDGSLASGKLARPRNEGTSIREKVVGLPDRVVQRKEGAATSFEPAQSLSPEIGLQPQTSTATGQGQAVTQLPSARRHVQQPAKTAKVPAQHASPSLSAEPEKQLHQGAPFQPASTIEQFDPLQSPRNASLSRLPQSTGLTSAQTPRIRPYRHNREQTLEKARNQLRLSYPTRRKASGHGKMRGQCQARASIPLGRRWLTRRSRQDAQPLHTEIQAAYHHRVSVLLPN